MFSNEDVTIGAWMLAMNVNHEDNRALCEPECKPTSIAVWDIPRCSGQWLTEPSNNRGEMVNGISLRGPQQLFSFSWKYTADARFVQIFILDYEINQTCLVMQQNQEHVKLNEEVFGAIEIYMKVEG